MSAYLGTLRDKYGDVFVSTFDDIDIPWKALSIRDYIKYQADITSSLIPLHIIEEEIFRKCVVDLKIVYNLNLKAGVVPTVAAQILQFSGPTTPEEFNQELELARAIVNNHPLHEAVTQICRVFSGYSPEEVYSLPYPEMMIRLAQAESVLLKSGSIKEGFRLGVSTGTENEPPAPKERIVPRDLKAAWERAGKMGGEKVPNKEPPPQPKEELEGKRVSPVIEAMERGEYYLSGPQGKRINEEIGAIGSSTTGWDKTELQISRAKMVADARVIYKDLLEELERKKGKSPSQ